jgi:hypothetical protein
MSNMKDNIHTKTLKVRIRDKHIKTLNSWTFAVNQVGNYCNEIGYLNLDRDLSMKMGVVLLKRRSITKLLRVT